MDTCNVLTLMIIVLILGKFVLTGVVRMDTAQEGFVIVFLGIMGMIVVRHLVLLGSIMIKLQNSVWVVVHRVLMKISILMHAYFVIVVVRSVGISLLSAQGVYPHHRTPNTSMCQVQSAWVNAHQILIHQVITVKIVVLLISVRSVHMHLITAQHVLVVNFWRIQIMVHV